MLAISNVVKYLNSNENHRKRYSKYYFILQLFLQIDTSFLQRYLFFTFFVKKCKDFSDQ